MIKISLDTNTDLFSIYLRLGEKDLTYEPFHNPLILSNARIEINGRHTPLQIKAVDAIMKKVTGIQ